MTITKGDSMIRPLAAVLALILLSGCASWRKPVAPPDFSSLAITTDGDPDLDLIARTTIRRVAIGSGAGLVGGAATGAVGTVGATGVCAVVTAPSVIGPPSA